MSRMNNTGSFPFMRLARKIGAPYWAVITYAEYIVSPTPTTPHKIAAACALSNKQAFEIELTVQGERNRRDDIEQAFT